MDVTSRGAALNPPKRLSALALAVVCLGTVGMARGDEKNNIAVYAGSKGTGVAKEALVKIDEVERYLSKRGSVDHPGISYEKSRPGLEGEVLLCIEPRDSSGRNVILADLQRIAGHETSGRSAQQTLRLVVLNRIVIDECLSLIADCACCFSCNSSDFDHSIRTFLIAGAPVPLNHFNRCRTIHRFDNANSVVSCAVFLARPR